MRHRVPLSVCAATVALIALPSTSMAVTKSVYMGTPPAAQKLVPKNLPGDVNDFFPHGITVHKGDSVRFIPVGFHTVDFPVRGSGQLPLVSPAGTISGVNDEAGQPFWFNGQPSFQLTPALLSPEFGKSLVHTGAKRIESGLPLGNKPKPMSVRFTKVGSFTYFCDVHHGMKGVVHVVAKRAKAPSARADAKVVARMLTRDVKELKTLANTRTPSGVVSVGASAAHGVEYYGFFPAKTTIPAGTSLRFQMPSKSTDQHTATTGPGNPGNEMDTTSYLNVLSASYQGPMFDQRAVYPSEVPGGPTADLTPTLHGNGFWNTGAMDTVGSTPLPASGNVRFAAPGTYEFYCLIHPFMHGTVTVT